MANLSIRLFSSIWNIQPKPKKGGGKLKSKRVGNLIGPTPKISKQKVLISIKCDKIPKHGRRMRWSFF